MMINIGSGERKEISFLDAISIISFLVGLQNLEMNITQEDMINATEELDKKLRTQVAEIHKHLEMQDNKLDYILEVLKNA